MKLYVDHYRFELECNVLWGQKLTLCWPKCLLAQSWTSISCDSWSERVTLNNALDLLGCWTTIGLSDYSNPKYPIWTLTLTLNDPHPSIVECFSKKKSVQMWAVISLNIMWVMWLSDRKSQEIATWIFGLGDISYVDNQSYQYDTRKVNLHQLCYLVYKL